jgi:hypothetical protein
MNKLGPWFAAIALAEVWRHGEGEQGGRRDRGHNGGLRHARQHHRGGYGYRRGDGRPHDDSYGEPRPHPDMRRTWSPGT